MRDVHPEVAGPRVILEPSRIRCLAVDVDAQRRLRRDEDRGQLCVPNAGFPDMLSPFDLEYEPRELGASHRLDYAHIQQAIGDRGVRGHERAASGRARLTDGEHEELPLEREAIASEARPIWREFGELADPR